MQTRGQIYGRRKKYDELLNSNESPVRLFPRRKRRKQGMKEHKQREKILGNSKEKLKLSTSKQGYIQTESGEIDLLKSSGNYSSLLHLGSNEEEATYRTLRKRGMKCKSTT